MKKSISNVCVARLIAACVVHVSVCELQLNERSIHDSLVNVPPHITKADLHALIFSVLSCLVSFHFMLDKNRQVTDLYVYIAASWACCLMHEC